MTVTNDIASSYVQVVLVSNDVANRELATSGGLQVITPARHLVYIPEIELRVRITNIIRDFLNPKRSCILKKMLESV